jgi:hypothetical protein
MTENALARRLIEEFGESMSASQIYRYFRIRKSKLPDTLETVVYPGNTRKRYACGSVARYFTSGRQREAVRI